MGQGNTGLRLCSLRTEEIAPPRFERKTPLDLPFLAPTETAIAQGTAPDRCDMPQNGNTLVLRLTDSLVLREKTRQP